MDRALAGVKPQATWRAAATLLRRPQPVTVPMVALFAIIPFYLYIGQVLVPGRELHVPEMALDRMVPVMPAWSVVYGSLFLAAPLPALVVHHQELLQRTISAFLLAWLVAYAFFIAVPTIGPRPDHVPGDGFPAWCLRLIYASDVNHNCFPSLHVAQCFLAALACHRVHRGVGWVAGAWALLVGASTVFTKQHYVADVLGGMVLAFAVFAVAMRGFPRDAVPEPERNLAPRLAAMAAALYGLLLAGLWGIHRWAP